GFTACRVEITPPEAAVVTVVVEEDSAEAGSATEEDSADGSSSAEEETSTNDESEGAAVETSEPTITPTPSPTNSPTPTPRPPTRTPTPQPAPNVTLDESREDGLNIRSGPSTDYAIIDSFDPGETRTVLGRNENGDWWQIDTSDLAEADDETVSQGGWVLGRLVQFSGSDENLPVVEVEPPAAIALTKADTATDTNNEVDADASNDEPTEEASSEEPVTEDSPDTTTTETSIDPLTSEELADQLRCGKDFCVTFQELMPIWENGGCVGNHSIYITVLEGLPPGTPMNGVVIGDTFNNVEVGSGSHGPGRTEITLWSNSMTLVAKRHQDGTEYTSEESFNFTSHDELIPPEVLASAGYCGGNVEQCRHDHQHNSVCRGHYSWRVTFHKFN
ncbi:MAG: SH3 domain-containing protein, partial [Chloroflexota bacterium]